MNITDNNILYSIAKQIDDPFTWKAFAQTCNNANKSCKMIQNNYRTMKFIKSDYSEPWGQVYYTYWRHNDGRETVLFKYESLGKKFHLNSQGKILRFF